MWLVIFHPAAEEELAKLSVGDRVAVTFVVASVCASSGRGAGRSRIRPLYGRVGDGFVVLAIGPEAMVDRRWFDRAVYAARQRLAEVDE